MTTLSAEDAELCFNLRDVWKGWDATGAYIISATRASALLVQAAARIEQLSADYAHLARKLERAELERDTQRDIADREARRAEQAEARAEVLEKAANDVVVAYVNYRGRGVNPAPSEYADLVKAIQALDATLVALGEPK